MDNKKCVNCQSNKLEFMGSLLLKEQKYIKMSENSTTERHVQLYFQEYLCFDCGYVMKFVSKSEIDEYNELRPYFLQ